MKHNGLMTNLQQQALLKEACWDLSFWFSERLLE
jgi:hypothetical protein